MVTLLYAMFQLNRIALTKKVYSRLKCGFTLSGHHNIVQTTTCWMRVVQEEHAMEERTPMIGTKETTFVHVLLEREAGSVKKIVGELL